MDSIDLHTHSTASDGTMSPRELAAFAKENGVQAIALTDHDTIEGLPEFKAACDELGLEGVSGVEISAKYRTELHILGLFVDEENAAFKQALSVLKDSRFARNKEMLEKIQKHGLDVSVFDVTGNADIKSLRHVGRAHIARVLADKGYADDIQDAFDKYLRKKRPCYVSRKTLPPKESIELIKRAGGLAILAHPIYITQDAKELEALLIELKSYGLDGVESYYSTYPKPFMELCLKLCEKLHLLPTGGSDFHADNKPDIKIGVVCGDMRVSYQILEDLKKRL